MLKKLAIVCVTAGALVLSAPAAALAVAPDSLRSMETYVDTPSVLIDRATISSCQRSSVEFSEDYFLPSHAVTLTISAPNGVVHTAAITSAANGSLTYGFSPVDGAGTYRLSFTGAASATDSPAAADSSGAVFNAAFVSKTSRSTIGAAATLAAEASYTATISVVNSMAGGCPGEKPAATAENNSGLAVTGGVMSPLLIGGGITLLVAGGILVGVRAMSRKKTQ